MKLSFEQYLCHACYVMAKKNNFILGMYLCPAKMYLTMGLWHCGLS